MNEKPKAFANVLEDGTRVENKSNDQTPEGVMGKLRLLTKDESFKEAFDHELNGELRMTVEGNEHMFVGLKKEDLARVSSLIGDIRFHVAAANDSRYDYKNDIKEIVEILKAA